MMLTDGKEVWALTDCHRTEDQPVRDMERCYDLYSAEYPAYDMPSKRDKIAARLNDTVPLEHASRVNLVGSRSVVPRDSKVDADDSGLSYFKKDERNYATSVHLRMFAKANSEDW